MGDMSDRLPGGDLAPVERRAARWNMAVAFVILFGTVGVPAMLIPILIGPIQDDLGWSRGDVSAVNSVKFAVGAATAFITGYLVERLGVRRLGIACAILAGLALLLFAQVHSLPVYYMVGVLLGFSALGTTTAMKILMSQWFNQGQGIAVGVAFMGLSMAGVVIPYAANLLIAAYGWRSATMMMSLVIWLVALPLFAWRATDHRDPALPSGAQPTALNRAAFQAIRFSPAFIALLLSNLLIGAVDEAMSTHLVVFLDRGVKLGAELAAVGFSLVMVMSNIGKIGFGWLIERFGARGAAACWMIAAVGVMLALPIGGLASFILFAIVYGPTQGGFLVNIPVLSKQMFEPAAMIRSIAVLTTAYNIGAAIGPAMTGYMFDMTGSYRAPFFLLSGFAVLAALLMLVARSAASRQVDLRLSPTAQ